MADTQQGNSVIRRQLACDLGGARRLSEASGCVRGVLDIARAHGEGKRCCKEVDCWREDVRRRMSDCACGSA
eukprot:2941485-Rhodomonas_salina.2